MAKTGLVLGVDIGGTNTALGLIDRGGRCHGGDSMPTRRRQPVRAEIAAPRRLHLGRQQQDRHRRPLARDAPGGRAGKGEDDDRLGRNRRRDRSGF